MSGHSSLIDRYIACWNEADAARRCGLIAETFTEAAAYCEPMLQGEGHARCRRWSINARLTYGRLWPASRNISGGGWAVASGPMSRLDAGWTDRCPVRHAFLQPSWS